MGQVTSRPYLRASFAVLKLQEQMARLEIEEARRKMRDSIRLMRRSRDAAAFQETRDALAALEEELQ